MLKRSALIFAFLAGAPIASACQSLAVVTPAASAPPSALPTQELTLVPSAYKAPLITPDELQARLKQGENIVIVDVRTAEAYELSHIQGAVSIPWSQLSSGYAQLPKDRFVALYCT